MLKSRNFFQVCRDQAASKAALLCWEALLCKEKHHVSYVRYGTVQYGTVPCRAVPCRAVPCRAVPCRPCRTVSYRTGGKNGYLFIYQWLQCVTRNDARAPNHGRTRRHAQNNIRSTRGSKNSKRVRRIFYIKLMHTKYVSGVDLDANLLLSGGKGFDSRGRARITSARGRA